MRERLIKLLEEADEYPAYQSYEGFADYFLNNGVVLLPCKVGDTLYHISNCITAEDFGKNYIDFGRVTQISIGRYGEYIFLDTGYSFPFDSVGKTVFLAKEDAEKALKGGAE
jgi:hypothetical protein